MMKDIRQPGCGGLCVGTRQALLQGWLLCVGFVCLANVPDLVRWVVCIVLKKVDTFLFDNPTASLQFIC